MDRHFLETCGYLPLHLMGLSFNSRPINDAISLVSFSHRPRASDRVFYGYTARYGALHQEGRVTLRQTMFPEEHHGLVRDY